MTAFHPKLPRELPTHSRGEAKAGYIRRADETDGGTVRVPGWRGGSSRLILPLRCRFRLTALLQP